MRLPKFKRFGLLLIVSLIVGVMVLTACKGEEPVDIKPEIKNPDTFVQATIADVDSFDPAYGYDRASSEQVQSIYEPLIYYDGESTTSFVPVLATEWTISEDGKTYRFKIREGVTFHNGNDLTPIDVEYSFERGMVQDYAAGPQWLFFMPLLGIPSSRTEDGLIPLDDIRKVVEVDGDWVQFNLTAPYEPFMQILCGPWSSIVDKEWCIQNGDWDGTQESYEKLNNPAPGGSPLHTITNGTGPFKLERREAGVETVLVRNDDYWRDPSSFIRIITKVVDEWTTRKLMLEAGDCDWAYVPQANIIELESVKGLTVYEKLPELTMDSFFFQFDINPESTFIGSGKLDGQGIPLDFFTDINVRKGFAYAFDWETFIQDGMMGEAKQVASPIVEGLPYLNPNTPMYHHDLAKAEEHLKKAWGGEVWDKGFLLILAYNTGNLPRKIACEILQQNLMAINEKFTIRIQVMQPPTMIRSIVTGLLPMFQIGWQADFPDPHNMIFNYMHSHGAFSGLQHYQNNEVDKLIEDGIAAASSSEREAIYYKLQELYYEELPSIALMQPLGRRYFRSWVRGFIFNPIDPSLVGHVYQLSKQY